MQLHETGAARRPRLGLPFGGRLRPKQPDRTRSVLTDLDLRRLVAEMVD
jgi:hypothetical protein